MHLLQQFGHAATKREGHVRNTASHTLSCAICAGVIFDPSVTDAAAAAGRAPYFSFTALLKVSGSITLPMGFRPVYSSMDWK
jgi:hypothetical protein